MACFKPIQAWQLETAEVVFKTRKGNKIRAEIELPCGKCIGCRQTRVRAWAIRCMHEAKMNEANCFITLTYEGEHIDPNLNYKDWQKFMYKIRQRNGPTRFFMSGEYGEINYRPHFHALLFGIDFDDRKEVGKNLYNSRTLEQIWGKGFTSVGDVTYQSAAYVAAYALKKLNTGDIDRYTKRYSRMDTRTGEIIQVQPEFGHMSLKPGIGYTWIKKYWPEVFNARDGIIMPGGKKMPTPRYYMKLLEDTDPQRYDELKWDRIMNAGKFWQDRTNARLATRELCAKEALRHKKEKTL